MNMLTYLIAVTLASQTVPANRYLGGAEPDLASPAAAPAAATPTPAGSDAKAAAEPAAPIPANPQTADGAGQPPAAKPVR